MLAFTAGMAQQPQQPEKPAPATTESPENRKRVELNLLGKEDAAAGESRRNENIQFNLIDNNALKELNVRLGATATSCRRSRRIGAISDPSSDGRLPLFYP